MLAHHRLIADTVEKIFDLVIPELALVRHFLFFGEISDHQYGHIGNFGNLDPEFKKFIFGSV